jgi:hypothetical protein
VRERADLFTADHNRDHIYELVEFNDKLTELHYDDATCPPSRPTRGPCPGRLPGELVHGSDPG